MPDCVLHSWWLSAHRLSAQRAHAHTMIHMFGRFLRLTFRAGIFHCLTNGEFNHPLDCLSSESSVNATTSCSLMLSYNCGMALFLCQSPEASLCHHSDLLNLRISPLKTILLYARGHLNYLCWILELLFGFVNLGRICAGCSWMSVWVPSRFPVRTEFLSMVLSCLLVVNNRNISLKV